MLVSGGGVDRAILSVLVVDARGDGTGFWEERPSRESASLLSSQVAARVALGTSPVVSIRVVCCGSGEAWVLLSGWDVDRVILSVLAVGAYGEGTPGLGGSHRR